LATFCMKAYGRHAQSDPLHTRNPAQEDRAEDANYTLILSADIPHRLGLQGRSIKARLPSVSYRVGL